MKWTFCLCYHVKHHIEDWFCQKYINTTQYTTQCYLSLFSAQYPIRTWHGTLKALICLECFLQKDTFNFIYLFIVQETILYTSVCPGKYDSHPQQILKGSQSGDTFCHNWPLLIQRSSSNCTVVTNGGCSNTSLCLAAGWFCFILIKICYNPPTALKLGHDCTQKAYSVRSQNNVESLTEAHHVTWGRGRMVTVGKWQRDFILTEDDTRRINGNAAYQEGKEIRDHFESCTKTHLTPVALKGDWTNLWRTGQWLCATTSYNGSMSLNTSWLVTVVEEKYVFLFWDPQKLFAGYCGKQD